MMPTIEMSKLEAHTVGGRGRTFGLVRLVPVLTIVSACATVRTSPSPTPTEQGCWRALILAGIADRTVSTIIWATGAILDAIAIPVAARGMA
jgi:hypothetical protein